MKKRQQLLWESVHLFWRAPEQCSSSPLTLYPKGLYGLLPLSVMQSSREGSQGRTHVRTVGFQGTLQGANSGAVIDRCRQRAQAWGHRPVREGQLREREDSDNEEARRAGPLSPQRSSQSVQGRAFLHVSLN